MSLLLAPHGIVAALHSLTTYNLENRESDIEGCDSLPRCASTVLGYRKWLAVRVQSIYPTTGLNLRSAVRGIRTTQLVDTTHQRQSSLYYLSSIVNTAC